mmetsp:Transcript_9361/g.12748  ORF Transcript_9361/g.12748 Transcript_9361/m.12748 type:complete len:200 (+) Transcript_9361:391-990(+)
MTTTSPDMPKLGTSPEKNDLSYSQSNSLSRDESMVSNSHDLSSSNLESVQNSRSDQSALEGENGTLLVSNINSNSHATNQSELDLLKQSEANLMKIAGNAQSNESKVGKILSESTQKAVITLVLSMLLSAAVLDLQLYIFRLPPYPLGLKVLTETSDDAFTAAFDAFIESFEDDSAPLLQVIVGDFVWSDGTDLSKLRS